MFSLLFRFSIEQDNLKIKSEKVVELTKSCLQNINSVMIFVLRIGKVYVKEENLIELQDLVDKHEKLSVFEITKENIINAKILNKKMKLNVKNQMRYSFDKYQILDELQVLFLGDGRVGKTSSIRSLLNKRFLLRNESTLLLNDIDIFGIHPNSYNLTPLSKYELSIQRVKNILPSQISDEIERYENLKQNIN
eukprot:snap_masked-scaffold_24-processed-gene-4.20-mRNA-1 protein AED:1.00 eAED:1.00 QI:0/0/0/0/1/1/2/0/192